VVPLLKTHACAKPVAASKKGARSSANMAADGCC